VKKDSLLWAALVAALVVTASAEYALARSAGFGTYVAGGVPAALDIYAVRALRARRDVAAVVLAMVAVNAASHLVAAGLLPVSVPLVVAVSSIAPLVLWRVHRLAEHIDQAPEPAADHFREAPELIEVPAEPADLLDDIQEVPVTLERVAEAAGVDAANSSVLTLGPLVPVAELLAGTSGDLHASANLAEASARPEPAEPAPLVPEPQPEPAPEPQHGSAEAEPVPPGVAAEHIEAAREWLTTEPELTGTAIGTRLGKSDSYGRRVRRAALLTQMVLSNDETKVTA
jgi:hypothetical protein